MGLINSGYEQDLENILADLHQIKANLKTNGIMLHPSCRFSIFEREIQKYVQVRDHSMSINDINISILTEGYRDSNELKVITSSKEVFEASIPILKQILKGTPVPSEDANSTARDKQFELYLAAILERTGFNISLEEPDIRFIYKTEEYSLAAKRIRSHQQINRRYREAIKQIKKFPYPGFIGISMDYLVRGPGNLNVIAGSPEAMDDAGNTIMNDSLENILRPVISTNRDDQVIGLVASLVVPSLLPSFSFGCISNLRAICLLTEGEEICRLIGSNIFNK